MRMVRVAAAFIFALPLAATANAQAPERSYRLGILITTPTAIDTIRAVTLPELAKLGFVEGRNLVLDLRIASPNFGVSTVQALVRPKPDALIGVGPTALEMLREGTATIPIVMSLGPDDPVAEGFAHSLARPGKNVTGVIAMSKELDGKRMQLLREAIPTVRRIGAMLASWPNATDEAMWREAAASAGLELRGRLRGSTSGPSYFYQPALPFEAEGIEALIIGSAPHFSHDPVDLVERATAAGLPTICEWRELVERGCLIGFGPSLEELRRRTAHLVARIFRGTSPNELPIEGPTKFELIINLKTAQTLGVTIPTSLLARADKVIE